MDTSAISSCLPLSDLTDGDAFREAKFRRKPVFASRSALTEHVQAEDRKLCSSGLLSDGIRVCMEASVSNKRVYTTYVSYAGLIIVYDAVHRVAYSHLPFSSRLTQIGRRR